MTPSVTLTRRPIEAGDAEFLLRLYADTRADEMALFPWGRAEQDAFLRMQYDAQQASYRCQFPDAEDRLLVLAGQTVGRVTVARSAEEIRLVFLALLPAWRNAGLGSALIRELLDEATRSGRPVRLHVASPNRAQRLYRRLGFTPTHDDGLTLAMEWRPDAPSRGG